MTPEARELLRWALDFRRRMIVRDEADWICNGCGILDREARTPGCRACQNRHQKRSRDRRSRQLAA